MEIPAIQRRARGRRRHLRAAEQGGKRRPRRSAHASRLKQREREREAQKKKVEARARARGGAGGADAGGREARSRPARRATPAEATVAQSAAVEAALERGLRVVLDLSYGADMSAREHNSLQRQLSRWGANRRAAAPVSLHLAGLAQCPAACRRPAATTCAGRCTGWTSGSRSASPASLTFLTPDAPTSSVRSTRRASTSSAASSTARCRRRRRSRARAPRRGDGAAAA